MPYEALVAQVNAKNPVGQIQQFYRGHIIPWLSDAEAAHLVRLGHVAPVNGGRHEAVEAVVDATGDVVGAVGDDGAPDVPGGRPRQVAPKEAWVDYGVAQGHDRALLESMTKADLIGQLS